MQEAILKIKHISKTFKVGGERLRAVKGVSFEVAKGELVAIVGPSGSGKTTLLHMIGGLSRADEGSITLAGVEISRQRDRALSRTRNQRIGFIFQNFSLLAGYTALENVCVPLIVAGHPPRVRRQRALEYLQMVGLAAQVNQRVEQLSGGQRQRVAIARALVMRPAVIVADEPTGSLDSARGHDIMAVLKQLSHGEGVAVVMVTHDPNLAAQADRQLRMFDGVLTEVVPHASR